jgi:hypothetical protein
MTRLSRRRSRSLLAYRCDALVEQPTCSGSTSATYASFPTRAAARGLLERGRYTFSAHGVSHCLLPSLSAAAICTMPQRALSLTIGMRTVTARVDSTDLLNRSTGSSRLLHRASPPLSQIRLVDSHCSSTMDATSMSFLPTAQVPIQSTGAFSDQELVRVILPFPEHETRIAQQTGCKQRRDRVSVGNRTPSAWHA